MVFLVLRNFIYGGITMRNFFSILKLIDLYFILLTIFYIYGILAVHTQAAFITFSILSLFNVIYFVLSIKSRVRLGNYIIKEKLDAFKVEHNMFGRKV